MGVFGQLGWLLDRRRQYAQTRTHDEEGSDDEGQEGQATDSESEAVNVLEQNWEGFEPQVHHRVDQGRVQVTDEQCRLERESERAADRFAHHVRNRLFHRPVEFRGRSQLVIPGQEAESRRTPDKNGRFERFRESEKDEREDEPSEPDKLKERPSPVLQLRRKRGGSRPENRPAHDSDGYVPRDIGQ